MSEFLIIEWQIQNTYEHVIDESRTADDYTDVC